MPYKCDLWCSRPALSRSKGSNLLHSAKCHLTIQPQVETTSLHERCQLPALRSATGGQARLPPNAEAFQYTQVNWDLKMVTAPRGLTQINVPKICI